MLINKIRYIKRHPTYYINVPHPFLIVSRSQFFVRGQTNPQWSLFSLQLKFTTMDTQPQPLTKVDEKLAASRKKLAEPVKRKIVKARRRIIAPTLKSKERRAVEDHTIKAFPRYYSYSVSGKTQVLRIAL